MLTLLNILESFKFKAYNDSAFYMIYVLCFYKFFGNIVMKMEFL